PTSTSTSTPTPTDSTDDSTDTSSSSQSQSQSQQQTQSSPPPDTTSPSVPGVPASSSSVTSAAPTWTWTTSADSESGLAQTPYTAQWSLDSAFGTGVFSATTASNSYTHAASLANGTWYFRVKAKDIAGNESAFSSAGSHIVDTTDSMPPQLTLNSLADSQTAGLFSLSWNGTDPDPDPADAVLPSGISSYSIYYATTPSTDGVYIQYKDSNNVWQNWWQGQANAISLSANQTTLSLWGYDGKQYSFFATAKDGANNQSATATVSTAVNLTKSVVMNEIAWAGTKASATDEWIELFNNTSASVSLAAWRLKSSDGSGPDIVLQGSIAAKGFYLIERTNDDPTSATADLTASFGNGVSNSVCEVFYLYDSAGAIVDQTACKSGGEWPAGSASSYYISMERIGSQTAGSDISNWTNNNLIVQNGKDASNVNLINGTPRQQNSVSGLNTEIADLRFNDASYEFSTITITKLGSPYYANIANFAVPANKTLVIEPGVALGLRGGSSIIVVDGTLQAVGTAANPITFDAYVPEGASSGLWCGMKFNSSSANSRIEHAAIKNADSQTAGCGSGNPTFAVFANGSSMTLKNSTVAGGNAFKKIYLKNSNSVIDGVTVSGATGDNSSASIYVEGGSPTIQNSAISGSSIGVFAGPSAIGAAPTVSGNMFTGNTYAVKLNSAFGSFSGNSANGNTYEGIWMEGALSSASSAVDTVTMQADGIPYIINSFTIDSGKTISFAAGSVIKFLSEGELTVNGTLKAYGTAANPVVFTKLSGSGFWKRIYFNSGASGSALEHTIIEYGASSLSDYYGALYVRNQSEVALDNVQIKNSDKAGIFSFNGNISGDQVTFSGNQYALFVQTGSCPVLTNAVFASGQAVNNPSGVSCSY
ncbi:MAG: lamin tail domain-containing protein, partial [Candidatus Wildermuthbacteria bacterium]|nr:lamin tail domain-containing protein [Candidatus Wildermuthbacteria bacterium]